MVPDLSALIARLEAAPEGSEKLDVAVARAFFGYKQDDPLWHVMPYTTSLDAAMTLVPEDWQFLRLEFATISEDGDEGYGCMLTLKHDIAIAFTGFSRRTWPKTPALALCAAALRARGEQS